jgi:hypothetical protein
MNLPAAVAVATVLAIPVLLLLAVVPAARTARMEKKMSLMSND